jgi:sec-independent protein translocase protein TatB
VPLNLSFTHLLVVAIVALVVLGPERLPQAARTAGNLLREWRRLSGDLQAEVRDVFSEFTDPFNDALTTVRTGEVPDPTPPPATTNSDGSPPAAATQDLAPALPALGPSTPYVSPGPEWQVELPSLGPAPQPETFVPGPGDPSSP